MTDQRVLPAALGALRMLKAGESCGAWAQTRNAQILHGHGLRWSPLFAAAAVKSRLPLVITLHNLLPVSVGWLPLALMRMVFTRAARIIAVSQAVANGAARTLGNSLAKRLRVVHNGIDLRPFEDSSDQGRADARRALGWPMDAPVALCVARLSPEKNVEAFVDAAALIEKSDIGPTARFAVAGGGPERDRLAARATEFAGLADRFEFLGSRDDVPLLMRAANVLCIPSREEGLGLVAIEAMAAGRAVVASRVGGLPEVIADQQTGILVDGGAGAGAFADAMLTLLRYPERQERMGVAGALRARTYFSAERMIAETRAVYEEALGS